jgi:hypothetical protein
MNSLIQKSKKRIMNIENTKAQMRKVFSSFASIIKMHIKEIRDAKLRYYRTTAVGKNLPQDHQKILWSY